MSISNHNPSFRVTTVIFKNAKIWKILAKMTAEGLKFNKYLWGKH